MCNECLEPTLGSVNVNSCTMYYIWNIHSYIYTVLYIKSESEIYVHDCLEIERTWVQRPARVRRPQPRRVWFRLGKCEWESGSLLLCVCVCVCEREREREREKERARGRYPAVANPHLHRHPLPTPLSIGYCNIFLTITLCWIWCLYALTV